MKYFCNPLNLEYKYQFNKQGENVSVSREAADPSLILFKGRYYLFISMSCGFWYSDDMLDWKFHPLKNFQGYDYAPDICPIGDYLILSASSHEYGRFYRTKDLFSDEFEVIDFPFAFWDPALFLDDDSRLYLYWGCGPLSPIFGIEIDPETLQPIGETNKLILCDEETKGFERRGENHFEEKLNPEEIEARISAIASAMGMSELTEEARESIKGYFAGHPYNEGAWMTKQNGRYYLQYGTPGTQYNVYCNAVYVSDGPLGNYEIAKNNPFSYKPGGFIPGAGHGSTLKDKQGDFWHSATMRISVNQVFERRVGLWRAGFDNDGELFCDQRYGDFPYRIDQNPWEKPDFMLLSYNKSAKASSFADDKTPDKAFDENIQTWWRAQTNNPDEWLEVDLGMEYDVRAIQINFADDGLSLPIPEGAILKGSTYSKRWIDEKNQFTRWILEGSVDGLNYFVIEDKSKTKTDLPHDFILRENGIKARYIRLTVVALPYGQAPCVSGLRVFGNGNGEAPKVAANVSSTREGELDVKINWEGNATGYVALWGYAPDKLYHSFMVFSKEVNIGALAKGQPLYVRVDSFNENGITEGQVTSEI